MMSDRVQIVPLLAAFIVYVALVVRTFSAAVRRRLTYRQVIVPTMALNVAFIQVFCLCIQVPLSWSLVAGAATALIHPLYIRGFLLVAGELRKAIGRSDLTLDTEVTWIDRKTPGSGTRNGTGSP